jgi:hypothetical protein
LPTSTCRRVLALAQILVQVRVQVLARAQVLAHNYLSASTCRQALATRTWRLLVSCRSPLVLRSAFGTLAHKIGGLRTTRAKPTSRSQDREAKAARARSREALSYLAAASGRASTSTCASTCASTGTCPQVIVGKSWSASTCTRAHTCTSTCASTCASTSNCPQVFVGNYSSAKTCHKYLPTPRGLTTRTAFRFPSSGSQDRGLENHAEVYITKPRWRGHGREDKLAGGPLLSRGGIWAHK